MVSSFLSSFVLVLRNFFRLIIKPYSTMRKIAAEKDLLQIGIIFFLTYLYFLFATAVRVRTLHPLLISKSAAVSFGAFLVTHILVVAFFYFLGRCIKPKEKISFRSISFLFAYSLLPTFIWFMTTSALFVALPPPRNPTFLGKAFSMVFIVFSISLLLWRTILLYLSVRFALKVKFYTIVTVIALFLAWFLPYSYAMYKLHIFRIPYV
jgi:hypothetical protein